MYNSAVYLLVFEKTVNIFKLVSPLCSYSRVCYTFRYFKSK